MNPLYHSDFAIPFAATSACRTTARTAGSSAIVINGKHPSIQRDIAKQLQKLLDSHYVVVDLFITLPMLGINRQTGKAYSSLQQAITLQPDATNMIIEQLHALTLQLIADGQSIILCHELWHHPIYKKFVDSIEQRNPLTINIAHNSTSHHSFSLTLDPYVHSADETAFIIYQSIIQ